MLVTLVLLVGIAQILQTTGMKLAAKFDLRQR